MSSREPLQREAPRPRPPRGSRAPRILAGPFSAAGLQRAYGNRAIQRFVVSQRAAINPAAEFGAGADRPVADVTADIDAGTNRMLGFGANVGGIRWRTKVQWTAPHNAGGVWQPDGEGMRAIVGPDHPQGGPPELEGAFNAGEMNRNGVVAPGG